MRQLILVVLIGEWLASPVAASYVPARVHALTEDRALAYHGRDHEAVVFSLVTGEVIDTIEFPEGVRAVASDRKTDSFWGIASFAEGGPTEIWEWSTEAGLVREAIPDVFGFEVFASSNRTRHVLFSPLSALESVFGIVEVGTLQETKRVSSTICAPPPESLWGAESVWIDRIVFDREEAVLGCLAVSPPGEWQHASLVEAQLSDDAWLACDEKTRRCWGSDDDGATWHTKPSLPGSPTDPSNIRFLVVDRVGRSGVYAVTDHDLGRNHPSGNRSSTQIWRLPLGAYEWIRVGPQPNGWVGYSVAEPVFTSQGAWLQVTPDAEDDEGDWSITLLRFDPATSRIEGKLILQRPRSKRPGIVDCSRHDR